MNVTTLAKTIETLKKGDTREIRIVLEALLVELGRRAMKGYENEPRECIQQSTKESIVEAMDALDEAFEKGVL